MPGIDSDEQHPQLMLWKIFVTTKLDVLATKLERFIGTLLEVQFSRLTWNKHIHSKGMYPFLVDLKVNLAYQKKG